LSSQEDVTAILGGGIRGRSGSRAEAACEGIGEAINGSLSDSEQISGVVARIKDRGYELTLVLEATVEVSREGEESSLLRSILRTKPELKVGDQI